MDIAGVLLVGGESRRFGRQKAFAHWKDKEFYQWSFEALNEETQNTVIISHPSLEEKLKTMYNQVYLDDLKYRGKGPLAGLYTGMKKIKANWYAILPCDTPNITGDVLAELKELRDERFDAIVPVIEEKKQPLIALYHKRTLPFIIENLEEGNLRMSSLLDSISVLFANNLKSPSSAFLNINDQDTYQKRRSF
ncbi:molybdenum cofactor guanylyltransferase [Priestia filamentosa]|uniref:molybdenum cofactor guanylyltransferase n=1 Tax=Priestia filamentosa TaxID=1402861 RepID=UPI00397CF142